MRLAAMLTLLLLSAATAAADEVKTKGPLRFSSHRLELPGRVVLSYYEDIDLDGLTDVLAVHAGEQVREAPRNLVVFFQRPDGFGPEPDLRYRVPDDVCVIDIGDVNPHRHGQELVLLHRKGINWLELAPDRDGNRELRGRGRPLIRTEPLFAHSNPDQLEKRDFARAVDDADAATLFVPTTDGYEVFYPDDGYDAPVFYPAKHLHRVGSDRYAVTAAELHIADTDGDGAEDLVTVHRDEVRIHYQVDGRFNVKPDREIYLDIITDADWEATRAREEGRALDELIGTQVDDFDNDGFADLFVWKTLVQKKAVVNDKQQYQLYRSHHGNFELIPDQAFVLKSFDRPAVVDLNGDGRLDMITGYFEFSVGNLIKALLAKRFTIDVSFFLHGEDGFPDQPDETRDVKIRFSLSNMDDNFAPAVELEDDFDGDGKVDFLLQTEDEKLEIFLGTMGEGRLFEKKASVELETPACNWAHVDDFNGDGRADVAFDRFPDREPFNESWINVVLSRGSP